VALAALSALLLFVFRLGIMPTLGVSALASLVLAFAR
jgi:hypothetical protein